MKMALNKERSRPTLISRNYMTFSLTLRGIGEKRVDYEFMKARDMDNYYRL